MNITTVETNGLDTIERTWLLDIVAASQGEGDQVELSVELTGRSRRADRCTATVLVGREGIVDVDSDSDAVIDALYTDRAFAALARKEWLVCA